MSRLNETERLYEVLKRPLITEKSTSAMARGQYTFEVLKDATKIEIKKAMELLFPGRKVKEVKTIYMPSHEKRRGTKHGRTQSGKKAIITIIGEPIEEIVGA
ncbi:MAG: 50S ribosomal protein L23 [Candidatus Gastranaerophilales bacterium]|nr:50S ribosomal protein L23 [Candidatus Gastranaerophilales bacterium]